MDEVPVAHNCGQNPMGEAVASQITPEDQLATVINRMSAVTVSYYWKLLGDEPNSMCRLLDVPWSDMRLILRKCNVLYGPNDKFKMKKFENLMERIGCQWSCYRPHGKPEHFICVGDNVDHTDAVTKPKEMYSTGASGGGMLQVFPVQGVHMPGVRTKVLRKLVEDLVMASTDQSASSSVNDMDRVDDSDNQSNKGSMTMYVNELLDIVRRELLHAASQGERYSYSQRANRMLRKAAVHALKGSLRAFIDSWVDRYGDMNDDKGETGECLKTPAMTRLRNTMQAPMTVARLFSETPINNSPVQAPGPIITPPVDLTADDVDEDERDIDIVLSQIKEEALLQNLLHKRFIHRQQRVITLEHKNGRKFRVVFPPDSQSTKSFMDEASRSRWVDDLLWNGVQQTGMLLYLAKAVPNECLRVATEKKIRVKTEVLNTPQTLALQRHCRINDKQLSKCRSFLHHLGGVELQCSLNDIKRIDHEVGLNENLLDATFGSYTLEWAVIRGDGNQKKLPEVCPYWNADILLEVTAEIDLFYHKLFLEKPDDPFIIMPPIDYRAPGFTDKPGMIVLFGGDHGAGACPCSLKLNFSSPQERKSRGELNWRCPTIQIASIDCAKDTYELLVNTVMPTIKSQLIELRNSAAFLVYSPRQPRKYCKAFLFPKDLEPNSFTVNNEVLSFQIGGQIRTVNLGAHFNTENDNEFNYRELRVIKVISHFHDLYVGDLAFLAMAIGMNHSAGSYCIACHRIARQFNCDTTLATDLRTRASLIHCLTEYNRLRLRRDGTEKKSVRNHLGVNTLGLLDIEPHRIIVPTLHCPMGLVDKVLVTFKEWVVFHAEALPAEANDLRVHYKNALANLKLSQTQEAQAVILDNQAGNTQESVAHLNTAKEARAEAKSNEVQAKKTYDEMVKRHSARVYSLSQRFDCIFRSKNIRKEHYHGGKYNGVNCIRIMEQSEELFDAFALLIVENKAQSITDDDITSKCNQFARLFGLLDTIWSNVRGIEGGLLPTNEQVNLLRKAIQKGKALWISMNMSTLQPKWHMVFDGHLLQQVITYGGLADKSDDTIELQHQVRMRLRDRYRSVTSYERRETCIRRELRRRKSPEINHQIDSYEAAKRLKSTSKRQEEANNRHTELREAKRVKREAVVDD